MEPETSDTPIIDLMRGRLPAIAVEYQETGAKPGLSIGSGWFLEDDGDLFVVVAAHWWKAIESLGKQANTSVRLLDGMSEASPSVPLGELSLLPVAEFSQDDLGLDIALVWLQGLIADNVRANPRFQPFLRSTMYVPATQETLDEVDEAYVLGYPEHDVSFGRHQFAVKPSALGVVGEYPREQLQNLTPVTGHVLRSDWGYLRIGGVEDLPPGFSVRGMSGGPVVLRVDETVLVAGTQTLWWPKAAAVGIQPVDKVVRILDEWRSWKEKRGDSEQPPA